MLVEPTFESEPVPTWLRHVVHCGLLDTVSMNFPLPHLQTELPAAAVDPVTQLMQALLPLAKYSENVLAAHVVQLLLLVRWPAAEAYLPAGQPVHAFWPAFCWYCPAGHMEQAEAVVRTVVLSAAKRPAGQAAHWLFVV